MGEMVRIRVFLALVMAVTPVFVGADGTRAYVGYAGYSDADVDGLEVIIGYSRQFQKVSVTLNYLAGTFYEGDKPQHYRQETTSLGSKICRDTRNGHFADKERCQREVEFDYAPSLELDYWLTSRLGLGAGYRGGDESGVLGSVSYKMTGEWFLSGRFGHSYRGLGVGVLF